MHGMVIHTFSPYDTGGRRRGGAGHFPKFLNGALPDYLAACIEEMPRGCIMSVIDRQVGQGTMAIGDHRRQARDAYASQHC